MEIEKEGIMKGQSSSRRKKSESEKESDNRSDLRGEGRESEPDEEEVIDEC